MSKITFTGTIACTGVIFGVIGLTRSSIQSSKAAPATPQINADPFILRPERPADCEAGPLRPGG